MRTGYLDADTILWPDGGPSMTWMADGACVASIELPWIADAVTVRTAELESMRRVCDCCTVREKCEAFADEQTITGGFWAGRWRTKASTPRRTDHTRAA